MSDKIIQNSFQKMAIIKDDRGLKVIHFVLLMAYSLTSTLSYLSWLKADPQSTIKIDCCLCETLVRSGLRVLAVPKSGFYLHFMQTIVR